METVILNNGVEMPMTGYGVFQIGDAECESLVLEAIEAGYRLVDTAQAYGNEAAVGRAVRRSGLPREELFVTTKVSRAVDQTTAEADIDASVRRLGLDYVDLLILHGSWGDSYAVWRAIEQAYAAGRARAIGISNFNAAGTADLALFNKVTPAINQIHIDPFDQKRADVGYLQSRGIVPQAWSPLGQGRRDLLTHPVLEAVAEGHGRSVAQVVLRWHLQRGVVTIPKTSTPERMRENLDIMDFELSPEEMGCIDALDEAPADLVYDPEFIDTTVRGWIADW